MAVANHLVADHVDAHVEPVDPPLELHGPVADLVEPARLRFVERRHDAAHPAHRLVDDPTVAAQERPRHVGIGGHDGVGHHQAGTGDRPQLGRFRPVRPSRPRPVDHDGGQRRRHRSQHGRGRGGGSLGGASRSQVHAIDRAEVDAPAADDHPSGRLDPELDLVLHRRELGDVHVDHVGATIDERVVDGRHRLVARRPPDDDHRSPPVEQIRLEGDACLGTRRRARRQRVDPVRLVEGHGQPPDAETARQVHQPGPCLRGHLAQHDIVDHFIADHLDRSQRRGVVRLDPRAQPHRSDRQPDRASNGDPAVGSQQLVAERPVTDRLDDRGARRGQHVGHERMRLRGQIGPVVGVRGRELLGVEGSAAQEHAIHVSVGDGRAVDHPHRVHRAGRGPRPAGGRDVLRAAQRGVRPLVDQRAGDRVVPAAEDDDHRSIIAGRGLPFAVNFS